MLEKNGYVNEFICGSDADFGGTSNFYKQHGNYKIVDYDYFKENGKYLMIILCFGELKMLNYLNLLKKI